jgi:hypothetical protein
MCSSIVCATTREAEKIGCDLLYLLLVPMWHNLHYPHTQSFPSILSDRWLALLDAPEQIHVVFEKTPVLKLFRCNYSIK